ncbi:hypothetical protein GLYMA_08G102701v4 [Glycine max]|nr:hypothetical protein GLYMA_08G102701v4 [Glycine max]KAH1050531.1 hypothetical protein GYH30_020821 [Glycine max]
MSLSFFLSYLLLENFLQLCLKTYLCFSWFEQALSCINDFFFCKLY